MTERIPSKRPEKSTGVPVHRITHIGWRRSPPKIKPNTHTHWSAVKPDPTLHPLEKTRTHTFIVWRLNPTPPSKKKREKKTNTCDKTQYDTSNAMQTTPSQLRHGWHPTRPPLTPTNKPTATKEPHPPPLSLRMLKHPHSMKFSPDHACTHAYICRHSSHVTEMHANNAPMSQDTSKRTHVIIISSKRTHIIRRKKMQIHVMRCMQMHPCPTIHPDSTWVRHHQPNATQKKKKKNSSRKSEELNFR